MFRWDAASRAFVGAGKQSKAGLRFIDCAFNPVDDMWNGIYNSKQAHAPDLDTVLSRANAGGVERLLALGTDLSSSRVCCEMAKRHSQLWPVRWCYYD